MKFSEKVKLSRQKAGLTQKDFADRLGMSMRTVTNYESGDIYPKKRETYAKIADILQVDINYLLTEDESYYDAQLFADDMPTLRQSDIICSEITRLFYTNQLSDDEIDELMQKIQDIYWTSKKKRKSKSSDKSKAR